MFFIKVKNANAQMKNIYFFLIALYNQTNKLK